MATADWYERRDELQEGQAFACLDGSKVKLDHRVPGDGSKWVVATWYDGSPNVEGYEQGRWFYDEGTIEPGDLVERLPEMGAA